MDSFKVFVDKWNTPAFYTIVLGGIIWGVQLNFATLELTERLGTQQEQIQEIKEHDQTTAILLAKTTAIVESLTAQLDRLERRMTRNEGNIDRNSRENPL